MGTPDLTASDQAAPAIILIVDDESKNRRLLQALLAHEGYVTRIAANGEDALATIADDPPDLILLDVMMPGLDGRQVARAVKADPATRAIPIIMVSAQTGREARLAALDAGAEDFLSQPLDRAELGLRVRNLLRLKGSSDLLEKHQLTLEAEAQERTAELQARTADLHGIRTAMDATQDLIVLVNRTSMQFVAVNAAASQMLGHTREELFDLGPTGLASTSRARLEALYDAVIAGQGRTTSIETVRGGDGSDVPVEVHRQAHREGADWVIVVVMRDITERIEAESRLEELAHFDDLTGLFNRTSFCEVLTNTLVQALATGEIVAILHLDLDSFKNVNDTYGRGIADELLIQVGDRLIENVFERDTVARLGGDEFALILTMLQGPRDAERVAERVQKALMRPFRLAGHDVSVTASIGITMHPDDATDTPTLLRYADTAMYQAKQSGRDAFQFFTSAMDTEVWRRLELETALRHAVKNGEFVLHYQPKVDLRGGHIVGLEALLCWDRPGFGLVPPSEFMYSLEESGFIVDVGRWVIATACEQVRDWSRRGIDPVQISVSVSERQLVRGDLEGDVLLALESYEVPARLLELQIAETLLMTSTDRTVVMLENLRAAGVQVSIVDCGTGQASFAYLSRFPVDRLKIDSSFTRDLTQDSEADAIALSTIRKGHSLGLEVIADGVETAAQLKLLRDLKCDQIQGELFSGPLGLPALEVLLLAHATRSAPGDDTVLS